jgi:hypothetical protein
MRIAGLIVLGGLLLGASGVAEARWLVFGSKQPKPIKILDINRNWNSTHGSNQTGEHKYNKPGWGAQWKQIFRDRRHPSHPYVRGY